MPQFICLAGFPSQIQLLYACLPVITLLAPTIEPESIFVPFNIVALCPIHT